MLKMDKEEKLIVEGQILNNIMYSRMIRSNKNFILGVFGKTGSGKSYTCLRIAELWYAKKFKKPFPVGNICFSAEQLISRLRKPISKGELIIFEEAGVSMGSLDFQSKIAKAMNYVLQSFRSMNVCLILNLPYFSMLNKQTRTLMHMRIMTHDIDRTKKEAIVKPQWLSYSQDRAEPYHPRIQIIRNGFAEKIDFLHYKHPDLELAEEYEEMKSKFLKKILEEVHTTMKGKEAPKPKVKDLTEQELKVHHMKYTQKMKQVEIARELGVSEARISEILKFTKYKAKLLKENSKS